MFSLLLCAVVFFAEAQTEQHECRSVSPSPAEQISLEKIMKEIIAKQEALKKSSHGKENKIANAGTSCVPIKIHDVTSGAGAGAVNMTKLNQDIANLNLYFQAANLEFYFCGTVSTFDNATYYDFDSAEEPALIAAEPSVTNAFNLYLVNSVMDAGQPFAGYAYFPNNSLLSTFCVMDKDVLAGAANGTIVHEYGHHFNLYHTFQSTESGNSNVNAEHVPRSGGNSNCTTKGDLLCDTEADPRGTVASCVYTGGGNSQQDIFGNPYTPPINNIMSYYPDNCGGIFTAGQITRVSAAYTVRSGHTNYSLNCPATAVTAASGLAAAQVGVGVDLTWTDNAGNEMGYLIERSTTSASSGFVPLAMGGVAANAVTYTDLTVVSNTSYWYRIKASNGNCNTYSNVAPITTGLIYCLPVYANSVLCQNAYISNVTFTGTTIINNSSSCDLADAYTDYTTSVTAASVTAGSSYPIAVARPTGSTRFVQVFIDFNQDGDFNDANEKLLPDSYGTFTANVLSGTLAIPVGATNGTTRMRVIMRNNTIIATACETSNNFFGEAEDYSITVTGGLPVELISFQAKPLGGQVVLNWATTLEVNNDHFELERSGDGKMFSTIAEIKGMGNTYAMTHYEKVDANPLYGNSFYRLKQVDRNGKSEYSEIVSAERLGADNAVRVSPNPTTGLLTVDFETWEESPVSLQVRELTGRILIAEKLVSTIGINSRELMMQNLPHGIYIVTVVLGEKSNTFRIVKQ